MKAPEKIYLYPYSTDGIYEVETKPLEGTVEYTRTDAFIEKACSWLEKNLSKYSELTDEDEYGNKLNEVVMNIFYGQAVNDFKNYMKGE